MDKAYKPIKSVHTILMVILGCNRYNLLNLNKYNEGKLRIISDNKQYEPIEATPDQVRINGKVIWFGRDLER